LRFFVLRSIRDGLNRVVVRRRLLSDRGLGFARRVGPNRINRQRIGGVAVSRGIRLGSLCLHRVGPRRISG
jgi:hypothetical protein